MSISLKQITAIARNTKVTGDVKVDMLMDLLDQYEPLDNPEDKALEKQYLLGKITLDDYLQLITKK